MSKFEEELEDLEMYGNGIDIFSKSELINHFKYWLPPIECDSIQEIVDNYDAKILAQAYLYAHDDMERLKEYHKRDIQELEIFFEQAIQMAYDSKENDLFPDVHWVMMSTHLMNRLKKELHDRDIDYPWLEWVDEVKVMYENRKK